MSILSGYKKFKKYIKTSSGFQLQSLWTSANTVEADDKRTIQTKVGAINGISSSETANSAEIAASTALTNKMNGTINNLNRDLGGLVFAQDAEGNWGYKIGGADPVIPFRNPVSFMIYGQSGGSPNYCEATLKDFDCSKYHTLTIGTLDGKDPHNASGVIYITANGDVLANESVQDNTTFDVSMYALITIKLQYRYAKSIALPVTFD